MNNFIAVFLILWAFPVWAGTLYPDSEPDGEELASLNGNQCSVIEFTMPETGTVSNSLCYVYGTSKNAKMVIFNSTSHTPSTIVATSNSVSIDGHDWGWKNFTYSSPPTLTSGTTYAVGIIADADYIVQVRDTAHNYYNANEKTNNYGTPQAWDDGELSESIYHISAQIEYTVSGGSSTTGKSQKVIIIN